MLCDHERGIEADAELADNLHAVLLFVRLFKVQGARLRDRAEVFLEFLVGHAAAVVFDHKAAVLLVGRELDEEVVAV